MFHRDAALFWIPRTICQEQSVEVERIEVIVPWHPDDLDAASEQATDDVGFHAAVYQHHSLLLVLAHLARTLWLVGHHLLATHLLHPVHAAVVSKRGRHGSPWLLIANDHPPHHHTTFAQAHRQAARIYSGDGRHLFTAQPLRQRLLRVPVRISLTVVGHNHCLYMYAAALHPCRQPVALQSYRWHAIVANQRIGEHEHLTGITGVGKTLRIACHGGIEHHFTRYVFLGAKRPAQELRTVVENQSCLFHLTISFSIRSI